MKKHKLIKFFTTYGYLGLCFLAFVIMDGVFRYKFRLQSIVPLYHIIPLLFTLAWCSFLTFVIYLCRGVWKKVVMIFLVIFYGTYILGQTAYYNLFQKYFTILDISLLEEGTAFANASYFHINYSILLGVVIAVLSVITACFFVPKQEVRLTWKRIVFPCSLFALLLIGARFAIPKASDASAWDSASGLGNVYRDYTDTSKSLLMSGVYEYVLRDIYLAYNPFKKINDAETIASLDTYFEERDRDHVANEMTGIFKDKNIMVIQLENIDQWMLTKTNMPTMYKLQQEGINFVNHYATTFATGKTFNTEFIVNTGLIPQVKGSAPSYIYSRNTYPNSLPMNFRKEGYEVNSFHPSLGKIYNREQVHKTFGYSTYYDYMAMNMSDFTMDSQMINGFDLMSQYDKFMNFIITYSGHGPFDENQATCSTHINKVKQNETSEDMVYLCGLAQAKETDRFIQLLVERLSEEAMLNDTVLLFYSDHYAYATIDEETELLLRGSNDPNLLSNIPFFIWSSDITPLQVDTMSSTMDILPTITNLFDFPVDYQYYLGNDIFSIEDNYVFFQDGSIFDGLTYYVPMDDVEPDERMKAMILQSQQRLNASWNILTSNYFAKRDIALP